MGESPILVIQGIIMEEKYTKRLTVHLPIDLHKTIKSEASWRGQSLKQYIIKAIVDKLANDERLNTPTE